MRIDATLILVIIIAVVVDVVVVVVVDAVAVQVEGAACDLALSCLHQKFRVQIE